MKNTAACFTIGALQKRTYVLLAACLAIAMVLAGGLLFAAAVDSEAVDSAVLRAEARRIAVIEEAAQSVLAIFSPDGKGGGSGVVISPDGFALTNYHVVRPCGKAMKCGMADGRLYDAVLVGIDPTGDVALIKLLGRDDFPYARLADSDNARVGDEVFAMGNPFMLATDLQPTATWGIISGMHRYQFPAGTLLEYADCFQTDAAVNPGNSGGPLFDDRARVIGINGRCSFEKRGRVSVGVGYAISINQVKNFLGHLHSGRIVDHATLGATVGFDASGRVCIDDILEDSDAYRRGLRYDDEIVRFAGRAIDSPNALKNILGTLPMGWRVPLDFRRDGWRHEILVRLAGVHSRGELLEKLKEKLRLPMQPRPKKKEKLRTPMKPEPKDDEKGDGNKPAVMETNLPPPLPDVVKEHFQKKHGYANYHFNLANRRRVFDAWAARAGLKWPHGQDGAWQDGSWTINTRSQHGEKTAIELDSDRAVIRCGDTTHRWTAFNERASDALVSDEFAADSTFISLDPPGSGGLLLTLYLWRRLATLGPGGFGEVYYVGTAPLYGHGEQADGGLADGELADVVAGLAGGVECRFYFDRETHDLAAIEMFADDGADDDGADDDGADPCEVYLENYRTADGRRLPGRIEARAGDEVFEIFTLDPPIASTIKTAAHAEHPPRPAGASKTNEIIRNAQKKVVKIQGAGGFRGLEAYQSGLLISPQGHVLTAFGTVLDTDSIDVTLDDGRRLAATLVGADPELDVAILKIEAGGLPFFDLDKSASLETGSSVLALSNLFGVAMGNEPLSVTRGVVSAKTSLTAGLGAFAAPYHGPTYVLDASTNNPGAAGGALIDRHGRLAGMLGKELQNKLNRTWLNYAIPTDELKKSIGHILSGRFASEPRTNRQRASKPVALVPLGIALVPDVLQRTPPYIDAVLPGSAAAKAGLRADDLIVLVGDRLVQSCKELEDELSYIPAGNVLYVTVMRGRELIELGVK